MTHAPESAENSVTRWFGAQFAALHPLLQELHRHGGTLRGEVDIAFGSGVAGWVGRRLARKVGIPDTAGCAPFEVRIHHDAQGLHWERTFGGGQRMYSLFVPHGHWPEGYWIERTGNVTLRLTVDVIDQAWHWLCLGAALGWLRLPLFLLPRTHAWKGVRDGRYIFHVGFALPLLGDALWYEGALQATPAPR